MIIISKKYRYLCTYVRFYDRDIATMSPNTRNYERLIALYNGLRKLKPCVAYNDTRYEAGWVLIYNVVGKQLGYDDYYDFEDDIGQLTSYITCDTKFIQFLTCPKEVDGHYIIEVGGYGYDANGKPKYFDETHGHFASYEEAKAEAARMELTQEDYMDKFGVRALEDLIEKDYPILLRYEDILSA